MAPLNYATQYQQALDQAFPYTLYFGALYSTPNNSLFKWTGAQTISVPTISVQGRVDGNRDVIAGATRRYDNTWEPLTLRNVRKWSTLIHPLDIDETNHTGTIANITRVYNEEQKFPEMDAYTASKLYAEYTRLGGVAESDALTSGNVLDVFNRLSVKMSNRRVPATGRVLYVTPDVKTLITSAQQFVRYADVKNAGKRLVTDVEMIDLVTVVVVPPELMRTEYDFTEGWAPAPASGQINLLLAHPSAVITPVKYNFARLDEPSAGSEGKYVYYEESEEDLFILKHKAAGVQMHVTPAVE